MLSCDLTLTEEAAEKEPAWQGAGQEVGLQIWRIVVSEYTHTFTKPTKSYTWTHSMISFCSDTPHAIELLREM